MDINILRSIVTVLFVISFFWITWWAYSKKQKDSFIDAANLPFADEPQQNHAQSIEAGDNKS
ncbi:MAG: cbb3-type cytochrome c oxidase subunit 3 [Pseudomonadales bacterium]|nr:cbb3-type cytochrome c oxidase subunit 3 [Pseudomonadales bacterium]